MIITGMAEYESVCKNALVKWYNSHNETKITLENVLKGRGYLVLLFSDSIGYSRLYFCC